MTVGIGISCVDGIVLACDSLSTFGRGVPVLRYSNKVHVLQHDALENPVAVLHAGVTTFFDKFRDRALRTQIGEASKQLKRKLDIIDFSDAVCEPVVTALFKEYTFDRNEFLGAPVSDFSLALIVAGATRGGEELRAYFVHGDGLSERLEQYGTVGSGAAFAELFLRYLLVGSEIKSVDAERLSVYAIKGVELMDPNVGGDVSILTLKLAKKQLVCSEVSTAGKNETAKEKMQAVLEKLSKSIEGLVEESQHAR